MDASVNKASITSFNLKQNFERNEKNDELDNFKRKSKFGNVTTSYNLNHYREAMKSLFYHESCDSDDCVEKLIGQNVLVKDISSLTAQDLKLCGFDLPEEELQNIIKEFDILPNQDLSYEQIIKKPKAEHYNGKIIHNAAMSLETMNHILLESHYKFILYQCKDELLGERYYESCFAVKAMTELLKLSKEFDRELSVLKKLVDAKSSAQKKAGKLTINIREPIWRWIAFSFITTGALTSFLIWKLSK